MRRLSQQAPAVARTGAALSLHARACTLPGKTRTDAYPFPGDAPMQPATAVRFLAIPLRAAPLMLIAIFSALLVLAAKATLLGLPLALVLLSGFFNYAFVLLDCVADGVKEPPVLSIEMMNPIGGQRSLMLLVVVVSVFFLSSAAIYWFGIWFAVAMGAACAIVLPAMLAVQGATGSVAQSFNLLTCLRLIGRLGADYALILASIALMVSARTPTSDSPPAAIYCIWSDWHAMQATARRRGTCCGTSSASTPMTLRTLPPMRCCSN